MLDGQHELSTLGIVEGGPFSFCFKRSLEIETQWSVTKKDGDTLGMAIKHILDCGESFLSDDQLIDDPNEE